MKKPTCVAVFSGGLDSTVLLYHLIRTGEVPLALTVNYGQRHKKEILFSKRTIKALKLKHIIINLPMSKYLQSSSLLNKKKKMPHEHYTHENQRITVVPNRNMMLLSIAGAIAEDIGVSKVYYGAHKNDFSIYPDCRPEFVDAVSHALQLGTYHKVRIAAPFRNITKATIVGMGKHLNVPFKNTWSCYCGRKKACGLCGTDQERIEAFRANYIHDPIEYERRFKVGDKVKLNAEGRKTFNDRSEKNFRTKTHTILSTGTDRSSPPLGPHYYVTDLWSYGVWEEFLELAPPKRRNKK